MNDTLLREKNQITLPVEVVEAAGLTPGRDRIAFRFEGGEIRGRKLQPVELVLLELSDVPSGSILPKGWQVDAAEIAAAVREERNAA